MECKDQLSGDKMGDVLQQDEPTSLEAQHVRDISIKYPGAAVKTAGEDREDVGVFHREGTTDSCPSRVFVA
jgi:hypothetical protein